MADKEEKIEKVSGMKIFLISFFTSLIVAFLLLFLSKSGVIPWDKIVKTKYNIPDLSRLKIEDAMIICRIKGLNLKIKDEVYHETYEKGIIISQTPGENTISKKPDIEVVVSKGKPLSYVPKLKGLTLKEAENKLKISGLLLGTTMYEYSNEKKGTVIGIEPPEGTELPFNASVNLKISKGKKLVSVPKITGKKLIAAQKILRKYGLILGTIKKKVDIDKPFGIILKQYPQYKKKVPAGTSITVILNEEE